ncbi:MAG: ShlB/FhaC/HecB family hemolysin secretion/activation protein [Chlamydiota bacterium]
MLHKSFTVAITLLLILTANITAEELSEEKRPSITKIQVVATRETDIEIYGTQQLNGIVVIGLNIPKIKLFHKRLKTFLGDKMTMKNLNAIKAAIYEHYKQQGFPITKVTLPAGQEITDGSVIFKVLTAKVGEIKVEGHKYFGENQYRSKVSSQPGEQVHIPSLRRDLRHLNHNPFRAVNIIYEPGQKLGETDITLKVRDRRPFSIFGGYEHNDNPVGGESRWVGGINFGNLFNLGHHLNLQYITAPDNHEWWATAGNYTAPLPWKHTLSMVGSYSKIHPDIGPDLDSSGKSWRIGGSYRIPLPDLGRLRHDLVVGYDFKRTNNLLSFGDFVIINNDADISQFLMGYETLYRDRWGGTSAKVELYWSPGGMTPYNKDPYFQKYVSAAKANYLYGMLTLERQTLLPKKCSWLLELTAQTTDKTLMLSEQLNLAGHNAVRGFREFEISANKGLVMRNELRTPAFPLFPGRDTCQLLAFFDYGWAHKVHETTYLSGAKTISSAGPGIRYSFKYLTVRADFGFQIKSVESSSPNSEHLHLSAILNY